MSEPRVTQRFLLYLLATAFGILAERLLNAFLPSADEGAALMLGVCIALGVVIVAVYLIHTYLPVLAKKISRYISPGAPRRLSVPNVLTGSRLVIAGFVLIELFTGRLTIAFWLYLAGLLTDILDGMTARSLYGATDWGKQFDAEVDAIFNAATGAGLLWICTRSGSLAGAAVIASLFLLFVLSRLFAPTGPLPKYLSGFFRLVFVAFFLVLLPSADRQQATIAAVVIFAFGAWYEYRVMHLPPT